MGSFPFHTNLNGFLLEPPLSLLIFCDVSSWGTSRWFWGPYFNILPVPRSLLEKPSYSLASSSDKYLLIEKFTHPKILHRSHIHLTELPHLKFSQTYTSAADSLPPIVPKGNPRAISHWKLLNLDVEMFYQLLYLLAFVPHPINANFALNNLMLQFINL